MERGEREERNKIERQMRASERKRIIIIEREGDRGGEATGVIPIQQTPTLDSQVHARRVHARRVGGIAVQRARVLPSSVDHP